MNKGYSHVGRPTNEEVAARQRKKLLKLFIPVLVLLLILVIFNRDKLDNLMGNSVDYGVCNCEKDWTLNKNMCYKEEKISDKVDAYILGDADGENGLTDVDYTIMHDDIMGETTLDARKQIVYDINKDGQVSMDDLDLLRDNYISATVGGDDDISESDVETEEENEIEYVCPKDENVESKEKQDTTIITTIHYEQDKDDPSICNVTKTIKSQKKAFCMISSVKKPVTIELKNKISKAAYSRAASIKIYDEKSACEMNLKDGSKSSSDTKNLVGKYSISASDIPGQQGIFKFEQEFVAGRNYYVLLKPSNYYTIQNNCFKIDENTAKKTVYLDPLEFYITFESGVGGTITSGSKKMTKYVDVDKEIPMVKVTAKYDKEIGGPQIVGHKNTEKTFAYWTASRIYNNEKQYRCTNKNGVNGWYNAKDCYKKFKYDEDRNGFNLKISNNQKSGIILTANWKSVKEVDLTNTSKIEETRIKDFAFDKNLSYKADYKVMQEMHLDDEGNFYISYDAPNADYNKAKSYIVKVDKNGKQTPYVDGAKLCGHAMFDMINGYVLLSCYGDDQLNYYEEKTHGTAIYKLKNGKEKGKIKIANVLEDSMKIVDGKKKVSGRETMKIDPKNKLAIIRKDSNTFLLYQFDVKNVRLGNFIRTVEVQEEFAPGEHGQGYAISDNKLYIYRGVGRRYIPHGDLPYSVGYITVYSLESGLALQTNKVLYDEKIFREPEGVFVKDNYLYFGSSSTGKWYGSRTEEGLPALKKYSTIYRIKKSELY